MGDEQQNEMITSKETVVYQLLRGRSNSFLVVTREGKSVLVDTSVKQMRCCLMKELKRHEVPNPDYLVLTHHHYDHVSNAAFIRSETGAMTVMHSSEAGYLESGTMKIPEGSLAITRAMVKLAHKLNFKFNIEPCPVDIIVEEEFKLAGIPGIKTLYTPGHSNGSISLIVDDEIAIVGDVMVNVALFKIFPPFADDIPLLHKTWQKLLRTGCHTFIPAHGNPVTRENLKLKTQKRASLLNSNH